MNSTEHLSRSRSTYEEIATAMGGRRQNVLVVEDNHDDVILIQRKLSKLPVDADVAYSVQEAIALLQVHDYYLVLIDLAMPVEGGSVLVKWMSERKDGHGQPVYMRRVVCTGSTKSDELDKALKYGPLALMSKDFTDEHFLALLYLVNMPQAKSYAAAA